MHDDGQAPQSATAPQPALKRRPVVTPLALDQQLLGKTIDGRYELTSKLGEGGFGSVFVARHTAHGQECVVKVLKAEVARDETNVRRFFNEARVAAGLQHPNTVRVFDFGQTAEGLLYMAMERLNGRELTAVLRAHDVDGPGALDPMRTIHVAIGALKSLSEAHGKGLVHRDLKPDNIFLCEVAGERDFVKIIDFGIAKATDGAEDEELTRTGFAVGTPKYMSPEQARAEPLDGRSDLYSLGVILYQCLAGEVPFKGPSAMATLMMHLKDPVPSLREKARSPLPEGLAEVVERALQKEPFERFLDADDMRIALEEVLTGVARRDPSKVSRSMSGRLRPATEADIAARAAKAEDIPAPDDTPATAALPVPAPTEVLDVSDVEDAGEPTLNTDARRAAAALDVTAPRRRAEAMAERAQVDGAASSPELDFQGPTRRESGPQRTQGLPAPTLPIERAAPAETSDQPARRTPGGSKRGLVLVAGVMVVALGLALALLGPRSGGDDAVPVPADEGAEAEPEPAKGTAAAATPPSGAPADNPAPRTAEALKAASQGAASRVRACYLAWRGDRTFSEVDVAVSINASGGVEEAKLPALYGDHAVGDCVEAAVSTVNFGPGPAQKASVRYALPAPTPTPSAETTSAETTADPPPAKQPRPTAAKPRPRRAKDPAPKRDRRAPRPVDKPAGDQVL